MGVVYTANGMETILCARPSPRAIFFQQSFSNQENLDIDLGFPFCGVVMARRKDASNQITRTLGLVLSNVLQLPDTLK